MHIVMLLDNAVRPDPRVANEARSLVATGSPWSPGTVKGNGAGTRTGVDPARIPLYTAMWDVIYYGLDASNPNARYSAPNKLFEALAAGRAVLCNDCGEVACG
jgi:hypothetical protein